MTAPNSEVKTAEDPTKAVLSESGLNSKHLCDYVVNVATGCRHGCKFCYVPSTPSVRTRPEMLKENSLHERMSRISSQSEMATSWATLVEDQAEKKTDYWNERIGTALLREFEEFCRRQDYEYIQFQVLFENAIGKSFYRKQGYEIIETRDTELFTETVSENLFRGTVQ